MIWVVRCPVCGGRLAAVDQKFTDGATWLDGGPLPCCLANTLKPRYAPPFNAAALPTPEEP